MARAREVEAVQTLEQGSITFLYRPRVELDDMQRLLILLSPDGSAFERLIARIRRHRSARPPAPDAFRK